MSQLMFKRWTTNPEAVHRVLGTARGALIRWSGNTNLLEFSMCTGGAGGLIDSAFQILEW